MKRLFSGYAAIGGIVIVVFVVLVGALGYVYLVRTNSELAIFSKPATRAATPIVAAPTIASISDLDKASQALDQIDLNDDLSSINALESQL